MSDESTTTCAIPNCTFEPHYTVAFHTHVRLHVCNTHRYRLLAQGWQPVPAWDLNGTHDHTDADAEEASTDA